MKNAFFMEEHNLKIVTLPVDGNTAAITGTRIKLNTGTRVAFVVSMDDSTAAVATFTLRQHDAATAGNSKDLSVANPYYKKAGTATVFTKVHSETAAAAYVLATDFASQEGIVVFEVAAEDLDHANGYLWASLDVADTTAAKLLSVMAIVRNAHFNPPYGQIL